MIRITETSPVLSLKATAFYALSLVATTRYGCHALASKGWCTLKYGRDDPWPVLEDWFLRAQMATLLDNDEEAEQDMDNFDAIEELKSGGAARRSSSLQYTPILKDDNSDEMIDNENLAPRSASLSSR